MCDWGLPRRLYGRGAALCEASEFLAPERACGAWCGIYSVGKPPPARFWARPRGPEAFLRIKFSIKASRSILLVIIENRNQGRQFTSALALICTARGLIQLLVLRIDPACNAYAR